MITFWWFMSWEVVSPPTTTPPPPALFPFLDQQIRKATELTWLACDAVTGRIAVELPDLICQGTIGSLLSAFTSAHLQLPVALDGYGAPPKGWEGATSASTSMLVAVLGDVPVWAGLILTRVGGTEGLVDLSCVSLEGYLDRRYVGDHAWTGQDEASVIAAGLIGDANSSEGLGFAVQAPATGTLRDRTYFDRDDKTVYSALRELAGVEDGPEWTVTLGWSDGTQTAVTKTVMVRKRVGFVAAGSSSPSPTGGANAVFSTLGGSARYSLTEDYTGGSGANHVVASSSGEGDLRPQSAPARAVDLLAGGQPRYEYRFTPSTSITQQATLDAHAVAALALMRDGARALTITSPLRNYPRLGVDWSVGDDVGYDLHGHRHPDGLVGVARAVGWQLDPRAGTVSPVLLLPGQEAS
jgi:hypothetical protein